jgi:hypothetical protein
VFFLSNETKFHPIRNSSYNSKYTFISGGQPAYCNSAQQHTHAVANPTVLRNNHGRSDVLYHWFGIFLHTGMLHYVVMVCLLTGPGWVDVDQKCMR